MNAKDCPAIHAALAEMIPHFQTLRLAEMRDRWNAAVMNQRAADSALQSAIGDALVIEDGLVATDTYTRVMRSIGRDAASGWRIYGDLSGAFGELVRFQIDRGSGDYRRAAVVYTWSDTKAEAAALRWAEAVSLQWETKMIAKLGNIQNVVCEFYGIDGRVTITGTVNGCGVVVNQRPVWKWRDSCGSFVQWPALIYVDGERVTEAEYKTRFC